ncbi:uncharacterized protein LOC127264767 isoform X2 [Andrographis paniculata]|uniref:uncharacterized protein LOC127264767 isoform X2 n=1 Tax=Andrographis paniculata TaxID=175694 RepID=UPI0021E6D934|nr:uncharacterized protein LOC127264767 isoform X2 [Andrographis paniculata]
MKFFMQRLNFCHEKWLRDSHSGSAHDIVLYHLSAYFDGDFLCSLQIKSYTNGACLLCRFRDFCLLTFYGCESAAAIESALGKFSIESNILQIRSDKAKIVSCFY